MVSSSARCVHTAVRQDPAVSASLEALLLL